MRRLFAIMLCALLLSGCALSSEKTRPNDTRMVVLATNLPEETVLPFICEFENRTGLWVTVRTGAAREVMDMARAGQCDLILGLGADTMEANRDIFRALPYEAELAPWVPTGSNWMPVFASRPVIIYNRNLIQNNPPEEFSDLLDPMWSGQIAMGDPEKCDMAAMTLTILGGDNQSELEGRFACLRRNIAALLPETRYAVDEVAKGNASLAIVTSQMLSDRPLGSLGRVFPGTDTMVFTQAAGIPVGAANPEDARTLLSYFLSEEVQTLAAEHFDGISVLSIHSADASVNVYDARHAGQHLWVVMEAWAAVWEDAQ